MSSAPAQVTLSDAHDDMMAEDRGIGIVTVTASAISDFKSTLRQDGHSANYGQFRTSRYLP
jgi:hypothetical protein